MKKVILILILIPFLDFPVYAQLRLLGDMYNNRAQIYLLSVTSGKIEISKFKVYGIVQLNRGLGYPKILLALFKLIDNGIDIPIKLKCDASSNKVNDNEGSGRNLVNGFINEDRKINVNLIPNGMLK